MAVGIDGLDKSLGVDKCVAHFSRGRSGTIARFYGDPTGVKYDEPFVVKEAIRIDDVVAMPVRSI